MTRSLLRMNSASSAAKPASVSAVTRRLRAKKGSRRPKKRQRVAERPAAAAKTRAPTRAEIRTVVPALPPPRASSCSAAARAWRGTLPPRLPPRRPPRACAPCALRAKEERGLRSRTKPGAREGGRRVARAAPARTVSCRRHDARGLVLGLLQDRQLRRPAASSHVAASRERERVEERKFCHTAPKKTGFASRTQHTSG